MSKTYATPNDTFSRFWRATDPGGAFRLSVAYFRAIHSVVPHSVVSLRNMKWTTELGQPNEQNSRKHCVGAHGIGMHTHNFGSVD